VEPLCLQGRLADALQSSLRAQLDVLAQLLPDA
jgi:hypothetical protein